MRRREILLELSFLKMEGEGGGGVGVNGDTAMIVPLNFSYFVHFWSVTAAVGPPVSNSKRKALLTAPL